MIRTMVNQMGGAPKSKSRGGAGSIWGIVGMFLVLTVALLINAFIFQLAYNSVAPRLIVNMGGNLNAYRPLTFVESLLTVLLVSSLFF